ncbi:MAG: hypothetical protein AAFX03_02220 [Pseudomonadota bacterium]
MRKVLSAFTSESTSARTGGSAIELPPTKCGTAADLARIEAALSRMEGGRYGYCVRCGGRISLGKLDADPAAPICDNCEPDH